MASVVSKVAPLLKRAGFRKRRHGFNRATTDGLVQVVHPSDELLYDPKTAMLFGDAKDSLTKLVGAVKAA